MTCLLSVRFARGRFLRQTHSVQEQYRHRRGRHLLRQRVAVKAKIRHTLNEARILILGTQVLIGFQYTVVLEPGFEHLPTRWNVKVMRGCSPTSMLGSSTKLVVLGVLRALVVAPLAATFRWVKDWRR
jgi:hypothetical protein